MNFCHAIYINGNGNGWLLLVPKTILVINFFVCRFILDTMNGAYKTFIVPNLDWLTKNIDPSDLIGPLAGVLTQTDIVSILFIPGHLDTKL